MEGWGSLDHVCCFCNRVIGEWHGKPGVPGFQEAEFWMMEGRV